MPWGARSRSFGNKGTGVSQGTACARVGKFELSFWICARTERGSQIVGDTGDVANKWECSSWENGGLGDRSFEYRPSHIRERTEGSHFDAVKQWEESKPWVGFGVVKFDGEDKVSEQNKQWTYL